MKVEIYDTKDVNTKNINYASKIDCCHDGRHLITYKEKCAHCGHEEVNVLQVPSEYKIEVCDDGMESVKNNAQECLQELCNEILGKDYYIADPVGGNQANKIIVKDIIAKCKKGGF